MKNEDGAKGMNNGRGRALEINEGEVKRRGMGNEVEQRRGPDGGGGGGGGGEGGWRDGNRVR